MFADDGGKRMRSVNDCLDPLANAIRRQTGNATKAAAMYEFRFDAGQVWRGCSACQRVAVGLMIQGRGKLARFHGAAQDQ